MHRGVSGSCAASIEAIALAAALLGAVGCRARRDAEDARGVLLAYQEFQKAAPADRRPALAALAAAPCHEASICADRDACAAYGVALVRASELAAKARALGPADAGGNGAATIEERAVIIAGAEEAITEAERAEAGCTTALDRLAERRASAR